MTKLKTLSKRFWEIDQYMSNACPFLKHELDLLSPGWDDFVCELYKEKSVVDGLKTNDGFNVKMSPYNSWKYKSKHASVESNVFMLCSVGLLGINEDDFCKKKEWVLYLLNDDFLLAKGYFDILNSGARKASGVLLLKWIHEYFKNGFTNHKVVCGDGWEDVVTFGVPSELGRDIFDFWDS